jgi:integrase
MTYEEYKTAPFELKHARYNALTHWNRQINECLREVEQRAGLTAKLRMHNARHSFADLARRIMAEHKTISPYDIQLMMGHSNLKQTTDYMEELSGQDATQPLTAVFGRQ